MHQSRGPACWEMADSQFLSFLTKLLDLRGAGKFCAQGSLPFVAPGIVLKNGEDLALPLNAAQASVLRGLAEPAPYGMGTETRLDETVRKCWQIDAAELRWTSPRWQKTLDALTQEVAKELGVTGKVSAEAYKLLLYDTGGFFLPHRDTEKTPGMFGSLIISLPSRHGGGELVVRHQGQEKRMDFGSDFEPAEMRWAAFFADCEHEVLPVTKGHRLCLAFNLVLAKSKSPTPTAPTGADMSLVPGLRQIASSRDDDLTAILLEHRYTEASLSVAALKGDDRARAAALFAAAEKADLTARLALVVLHQTGSLEEGYDDSYYSRRRGRGSEAEEGEMGEIFDESLTITGWRTPEDKEDPLGSFGIEETHLLTLVPMDEGAPDKKEAEGFTGNAGCTMEHWYHRAAIVVWPKNATHQLLARYDFEGSCARFSTLAAKGRADKALPLGEALISAGKTQLGAANEWSAAHLGASMRPLLGGIGQLKDARLYAQAATPALLPAFREADCETWSALLRGLAEQPLEFFHKHTPEGPIAQNRQSWFNALDAALGHAPDLLFRFAGMLPRLAVDEIEKRAHLLWDEPDGESSTGQAHQVHLALAASWLIEKPAARKQLESWLWKEGSLSHLRRVLAPALLEKTHQAWFTKEHSLAPELLAASITALTAETTRPLPPYPDWRRPAPDAASTKDPLEQDLLQFMASATAARHEIRRIQADRTRLEAYVKRHDLDLDLSTERKGSPHTLVCRKNDKSHLRALRQRVKDEALLARLKR